MIVYFRSIKMDIIAVVSVINGFLALSVGALDYCNLTCNMTTQEYDPTKGVLELVQRNSKPGSHVLCDTYQRNENCLGLHITPLREDEKIIVLNEHNRVRNLVASGNETRGDPGPQPPGSSMMELKWDYELEEIAKVVILECLDSVAHHICMDLPRFRVNVNLFRGILPWRSNMTLFEEAIKDWFEGVYDMAGEDSPKRRKQMRSGEEIVATRVLEKYNHLLSGGTHLVGCAKANDEDKGEYLACIYGPKRTEKGKPLYEVGPPCSNCPASSKCSKQWPALCEKKLVTQLRNAQDAIYIPPGLNRTLRRHEVTVGFWATTLLAFLTAIASTT